MFQLLMNQQLSDKISTTSQDFWKPRCNQNVRFRMQEEENQTVVVTKPQQLFILWLWEYTYCRTSICYSIVQTRVQLVFGLSNKKVKYLIWLFKTVFFFFFWIHLPEWCSEPGRGGWWHHRLLSWTEALLSSAQTAAAPVQANTADKAEEKEKEREGGDSRSLVHACLRQDKSLCQQPVMVRPSNKTPEYWQRRQLA